MGCMAQWELAMFSRIPKLNMPRGFNPWQGGYAVLLERVLHDTHTLVWSCLVTFEKQVYATSDAMWNMGYWLLSTLIPQSSVDVSQEAATFRTFLQGAMIMGDATKVVGIFNVIHSVEVFDSGAQGMMLGARRRRHLLGDEEGGDVGGDEGGGGKGGSGVVGKLLSGLKTGFGSLLSLGQSVAGMAGGNLMAGADFSSLVSSQDPTVQFAGAAVCAPAIAWAQFTYQASLPIVLDVLGAVKGGDKMSLSLLTPVWTHLHDASDLFQNIVQARSKRACAGLRIMLGYSGSLGKALYYNCMAGQQMIDGMMTIVLTVMVDIPLYRCLCVKPAGDSDYMGYVQAECMPLVPPTRLTFWQRTMNAITSQSSESMQTVCRNYSSGIEQQLYGAFDNWKQQAIYSADSIASVLDEFFVPDAHAGTCQNTISNPSAMVLTPLPLSHYQVCAKTLSCQQRCADANSIFDYELQRLQNAGVQVNTDAQMYDVTLESPLFNRYASSSYTSGPTDDQVVAIQALPANNTVYGCQTRCSGEGQCMAVALRGAKTNALRVEFFCLPPPSMILATVYSTNLDGFTIPFDDYSDGTVLREVDFALQESKIYVILYIFRATVATSITDTSILAQSHEVYIYYNGGGGRALRTADLASLVLGQKGVEQALFDGGQATKPVVTNCQISSIAEIASGQAGVLVFFIAFTADIKAWVTPADGSEGGSDTTSSYSIYAIYRWYEGSSSSSSLQITFYPPCRVCTTPTCSNTCHPQLESALQLSSTGTFLYIQAQDYLYIPVITAPLQGSSTTNVYVKRVTVDPAKGLVYIYTASKLRLATSRDNNNFVGQWTRGSIFSRISGTRVIRDSRAHTNIKTSQMQDFPYFFQADGAISRQWLQEMRWVNSNSGTKLTAFASQQTAQKAKAQVTCTTLSCSGCTTSNLRLLCHQAQNCALSKCLGTIVQTKNTLCGVGNLIQESFIQAVETWHAMFMIGAELGILVAKGLSGQALHVIVLKFPTEQFYTLLCAYKDTLASVVALCMTIGQMLANLLGGKGLDLTGGQDIGALAGEQSLKSISMGGFFFNCITGSTLLPMLAAHRWIMCIANASMVATDEAGVSVQFGDVNMDTTWMPCAHIGSVFDVLNNNNIQLEIQSVVVMFVKFVITLVMGIGETLLFGLELSWDSIVDLLIGIVFSVQDLLYTFNLRSCKVPNYAMRYVLWCSCQDDAYMIPPKQRAQGISDGALWCVGTMSITLLDGSVGIIYNPYTMDQLSLGLTGPGGVIDYIACLSSSADSSACPVPSGEAKRLQTLVDQSVEPIAVWARCKTNYMLSTWDVGAGALFFSNPPSDAAQLAMRNTGLQWATAVGADFLDCMRGDGGPQIDYDSCMRLFFSRSLNSTPNVYYQYQKAAHNVTEPPDACLVFSGINASAPPNSTLQTLMNDCMMQDGVGTNVQACDLNPLVWSGNQPQKMPAASLHGTVPPANRSIEMEADGLYANVVNSLLQAIKAFESTFAQEAVSIDTILFSADGDFVHDFFDCMYLGPYTRVDLLACDPDGRLECPFYARDNMSGASRDFTACYGDAMHGDHMLPFTCGSQARRSLIKYFFRNVSLTAQGGTALSQNVSKKMKEHMDAILQNYTNGSASWGCWDPLLQKCTLQGCQFSNGYAPCLDSHYEISSEDVGDLILETVLNVLPLYYKQTMSDTLPLTAYYETPQPAQWGKDPISAAIAQELGLFAPHVPLVAYNTEEVYSMPPSTTLDMVNRTLGSLWGVCTSLLSQTAMSLPLTRRGGDSWVPAGFSSTGGDNMADLDQVERAVRNITQDLAAASCPFVWHKARRHAPSQSGVCSRQRDSVGGRNSLNVHSASIHYAGDHGKPVEARVDEGLTFPLFGFLQGQIGQADQTCVCATNHPTMLDQCVISAESCASFLHLRSSSDTLCGLVTAACASSGTYNRIHVPQVLACLQTVYDDNEGGVRCPELGPSDWWGLFPVDCTTAECDIAKQWMTTGANSIPYDATRFLNEGRAGMRLPNFRHVNQTYNGSIHYGLQNGKLRAMDMMQPRCFDKTELFPQEEDAAEDLADHVVEKLFPAAQALFDSPVTATCTRFVIETVRAEAMGLVSDSAGSSARVQAALWKRKCAAKVRQLGMCKMHGVFYDMEAPDAWQSISQAACGGIVLSIDQAYMTPGCVVVDRVQRLMFDAHLCLADSDGITLLNNREQQLQASKCALQPQPLDLVQGDTPLSMVHRKGGGTLASIDDATELTDRMTLDYALYLNQYEKATREHISHVLDWWPDDMVDMPPGYHPTAASDPTELAPALFDSYLVYDSSERTAFYVHSAVRNGSLLHNTAGAAGICRSHSVAMPMFDTNTNRICTRTSKKAASDTPTTPVDSPLTPGPPGVNNDMMDNAYIEQNFEPEYCAASHEDVPWTADPDDFQSLNAGGILGWQHYVTMDTAGASTYDMAESTFPPTWYQLADLPLVLDGWGPSCGDRTWGAGVSCSTNQSLCPGDANMMVCLPLVPNASSSKEGVCFSNIAHVKSVLNTPKSDTRQPCFRTDHCQDGQVCLVDGGCSPLYVHVWNDKKNAWNMETTILADQCGFADTVHPYTQSTRGATPWETVPDALHIHGMCSHHNWFSYRLAAQQSSNTLCPQTATYMRCNSSSTEWPWVLQRFDGQPTAGASPQTMADTLLTRANPCDVTYMHLRDPQTGARMRVCSGFEGHENDPPIVMAATAYMQYDLPDDGTWTGATMTGADAVNETSRWLRTYQESTGEVHIGLLGLDRGMDVPLGFLGANLKADGILGDMALDGEGGVEFFRCADRLACNNPPYTYNGVSVASRLVSNGGNSFTNLTETSLRLCGGIGYLAATPNNVGVCTLDMVLFPLFRQVLWGTGEQSCGELWPNYATANSHWVAMGAATPASVGPGTLFCSTTELACVYAARASTQISQADEKDGIASITANLNGLLQQAGNVVIHYYAGNTQAAGTRAYEVINRCMSDVLTTIMSTQALLQVQYGTLGPSGVYFAFSLTLYEIPLAWLHHAMLVTLLSQLDASVQAPHLDRMGTVQAAIDVDLWSADRTIVCADDALMRSKPVLWQIICQNRHPAYTFEPSLSLGGGFWADQMVQLIEDAARQAVINTMLTNGGEVAVFCHRRASWNCEEAADYVGCTRARAMAYNTSYCPQAVLSSAEPWLQVCAHPELFKLEDLREIQLKDLLDQLSGDAGRQITQFLEQAKAALLENLAQIASAADFIGGGQTWEELTLMMTSWMLPIVQTRAMDAMLFVQEATGGFDLASWLQNDVCHSRAFSDESICKDQSATTPDDSCLFPNIVDRGDLYRYVQEGPDSPLYNANTGRTEPAVIITYYANEDAEPRQDIIPLCDLPTPNLCVAQHYKDSLDLRTDTNGKVICDIASVYAPPGVEVQAFAIDMSLDQWETALASPTTTKWCSDQASDWGGRAVAPVRNCVWRQDSPDDDPHPGIDIFEYNTTDRFGGWTLSLGDLNDRWSASSSTKLMWETRADSCGETGKFNGFCAVKIRLENTVASKAICDSGRPGMAPNCAALMGSPKVSTFRICNADYPGDERKELYRCSACTKYSPVIQGSDGLFGCYASADEGHTVESQVTAESIARTLAFLMDPASLKELLQEPGVQVSAMIKEGIVNVAVPLEAGVNPMIYASLAKWRQRAITSVAVELCAHADTAPYGCWDGFDSTSAAEFDAIIWNKAITSPNLKFTMICSDQPYTEDDRELCNPLFDQRRRALNDFVQTQYRHANGLWMPSIPPGTGLAWKANVAHSAVGKFSLMYASADRKEEDRLLAWTLGQKICRSDKTVIQDRICVQSHAAGMFQAVHPWVGGDFNPFEGADECPSAGGAATSLCPCDCSPKAVCDRYLNTTTPMTVEFPSLDACHQQAFPRFRTMRPDDQANLCSLMMMSASNNNNNKKCLHPQGLFGSTAEEVPVSTDDLHGAGIPTAASDFLVQSLLGGGGGMWAGQTLQQAAANSLQKYAFLRMPREHMHPAHIAFGLDTAMTGSPLVMRGVALLPYNLEPAFGGGGSASWVSTLEKQWADDQRWIATLYPQLATATTATTERDRWSCPFRAFVFWGGNSSGFAPIAPDPLLTSRIFPPPLSRGGGAHPFIKARSLQGLLAKYETSNGACFYQKATSSSMTTTARLQIPLTDGENQCGLQGMVRNLHSGQFVLSRIINRFTDRCNEVLDTPNIDVTLRSGEAASTGTLKDGGGDGCGALHRLTPFLMRTRGDGGPITMTGSTTRAEGGECHMGRAFLYPLSGKLDLVGRQCALSFKNRTYGMSLCPKAGRSSFLEDSSVIPLARSRPQSLEALLYKKAARLYRSQFTTPLVKFMGPGGVPMEEAETSFGLLYSVSITRALAMDLLQACASAAGCEPISLWWTANNFWDKYTQKGGLVQSSSSSSAANDKDPSVTAATRRHTQYAAAADTDAALWNSTNWTWTFRTSATDSGKSSRGTVNKTQWLGDRFGACNDSYYKYGRLPGAQSLVKSMTLCEPAPTGGMQTLCKAMSQFRTDIANVNCQLMGGGSVCLYRPGYFYMPYMWSITNQEFMADTVLEYYADILSQSRFINPVTNEPLYSETALCPARNPVLAQIRALSLQQRDSCPGWQIEYLKGVLKTFKIIGHDLLYLGFCTVMAGANLIGMVFAADDTGATTMANTAMYYVGEAVKAAAKLIMPILDLCVDVLFGTSGAGKVIKTIFETLCEIFNIVVFDILIPIWCAIVRPILQQTLKIIQLLIYAIDKNVGEQVKQLYDVFLGGSSSDIQACLGKLNVRIVCKVDNTDDGNASDFPNQPMATRCWVDNSPSYYTAGGSVLTGTSTNSFLSCTVSDTCALDPLRFDNYENKADLVPCVSCPAVHLGDEGQRFGCNSYLKRCTCGVRTQQPGACLQNSDCSNQPRGNPICSVTSNIDFARDSVTSMPCTSCGGLGAEPVCVVDGAADTGVCTCMAIRQSNALHGCTEAGKDVFLLNQAGQCLIMTSPNQATSLSLSFSELALAPCMMGTDSLCVAVSLPLTSSGTSQQPLYAVLLPGTVSGVLRPMSLLASTGRRLLMTRDNNATAVDWHRWWCEKEWPQEDVRWCTFWKLVGNQSLLLLLGDSQATNISDTFLLSPMRLAKEVLKNPGIFLRLMTQRPDIVRHIIMQHPGIWPVIVGNLWDGTTDAWKALTLAKPPHHNINNNGSCHANQTCLPNNTADGKRKLLLFEEQQVIADSYYVDNTNAARFPKCAALEIPINEIIAAFWNTIHYYENINYYLSRTTVAIAANASSGAPCTDQNSTDTNSTDNTTTTSTAVDCGITTTVTRGGYSLPPPSPPGAGKGGVDVLGSIADVFMMIPTGGISGRNLMDGLLSNINYEDAVANNYITGRRVLKELSFCNYTMLTLGPREMPKLLPLIVVVAIFFFIFTVLFSPHALLTWILWVFVFPCIIYWAAYNLSPLCWPMIPPSLPHEIASEIKAIIPDSFEIPTFLVHANCTLRGLLSDGSYDPGCFKACSNAPFYITSWQDVSAWWLCEFSTGICREIAGITDKWGALSDMTSSLNYFADVVDFSSEDSDFVAAHRVCAIFSIYYLVFALMLGAFIVMVAPAAWIAIAQIFAASLQLLLEASSDENV